MSDMTNLDDRQAQEPGQVPDQLQSGLPVGRIEDSVTWQAIEERLSKLEQSLTDKAVNRLEKRLARAMEKAKAQGLTVTPQMQERLRQEEEMTELRKLADEDVAAQPVRTAPKPIADDVVATVTARMSQLNADYGGIVLEEDDDEFATVNFNDPKPDRFLRRYEDALKAKSERLKGPGLQPNPIRATGAIGGAANDDLMAKYKKEVAVAQTVNERLNIRNKYRSLGLEI